MLRLAAALGLVAVGCSVEQALPPPECESGASAIIVAQSVPNAELVPCLDPLPTGWDVDTVTIGENGTAVHLSSDRAGSGAASLHYGDACELGQAVSVPSDQEGAEAFEYIDRIQFGFRGARFYAFDGGCVWWEFDFDADASATLSIELQDSLTLVSRELLNDSIRQYFIDEEV